VSHLFARSHVQDVCQLPRLRPRVDSSDWCEGPKLLHSMNRIRRLPRAVLRRAHSGTHMATMDRRRR